MSLDNLCKQIWNQNVGPDLYPNYFTSDGIPERPFMGGGGGGGNLDCMQHAFKVNS